MLNQARGQRLLALVGQLGLAVRPDQGGGVVVAVEADLGVGDVVDDDGVEALAAALAAGVVKGVLGFGGEADHHRGIRQRRHRSDDVGVLHQGDGWGLASSFCRVLLDLLWCLGCRAVVRHRRHADHQRLFGGAGQHGFVHVKGAGRFDAFDVGGRRQAAGAGDQRDLGARIGSGFGDGVALLAGTVVGQEAHRVEGLPRGARGHEHVAAGKMRERERRLHGIQQSFRFRHASRPHVAAGLFALVGADQAFAVGGEGGGIALCGGVAPHRLVHGRRQQNRRIAGQAQGGEQVRRRPLGQIGHEVGGGRGD